MRISILTQNIWNLNYYWKRRKPLIVELIKELDPDIVALQEVAGKSKRINQLKEISKSLSEYNLSFSIAKKDKNKVAGMGVLSKHKIAKTNILRLSRYGAL